MLKDFSINCFRSSTSAFLIRCPGMSTRRCLMPAIRMVTGMRVRGLRVYWRGKGIRSGCRRDEGIEDPLL